MANDNKDKEQPCVLAAPNCVGQFTGPPQPALVRPARGGLKPCLPAIAGAERKHPVQFINIWPFAVSSRALIGAARPNPSVEARPNGGAPGPGHGYGVHFPWPGPGTPPSVPPHLKR